MSKPISHHLGTGILALASAGLLAASSLAAHAQDYPESTDPIRMTLHDLDGSACYPRASWARVLEEKWATPSIYIQADYLAQFAGSESGDLQVAMEIWETTGKDALEASLGHRRHGRPR